MTEIDKYIIGVLIPTFNRSAYLISALKSAREQSYGRLEIIVIDNGSTDGTAEYMKSVSDPRIRYIINETNIGMIGSINKGVSLFSDKVQWCTVLSDDDLLDGNCIGTLIETANTASAKSVVHSHRVFIDSRGKRIRDALPAPQEETALEYITMRAYFKRETFLTGVLFNRNAFREIKGYPVFKTGVASDDAFIFALALKDRLVFAPHALAFVRLHEEAESVSPSDAMLKIETVGQFEAYCRTAARDMGGFTPQQSSTLDSALSVYAKNMNSYWWVQAVQDLGSRKESQRDQLRELLTRADSNAGNYSFRVRLAVTFHKLTGILLERYKIYRICWRAYITAYVFVIKAIRSSRHPDE